MSQTAPQWFTEIFNSEVFVAYQRKGHNLRSFTRYQTGVRDQVVHFPKIGQGKAGSKPRHGVIAPMNLDHTRVNAVMQDKYAGEWIDRLDEMKTNVNLRAPVAEALALALTRAADEMVVDVLKGTTSTPVALTTTSSATMRNSLLKLAERFAVKDIDLETSEVFVLPCPQLHSWLMTLKEFTSSDYVDVATPYAGISKRAKNWLGFRWLRPYTALPTASNVVTMYAWERNSVGWAEVEGVTTDITWHGDRASWFFAGSISMGGTIIENLGIEPFTLNINDTLPTT